MEDNIMALTEAQNAVVSNPVNAALDALKSGKDVAESVYGSKNAVNPSPETEKAFTSNEFMEGQDTEAAPESETGSAVEASNPSLLDEVVSKSQADAKVKPALEEIIISDENGRKKITVDWNDKEKLKNYVKMAAGMRKFQAERDQVQSKLKEIEPKFKDYQQVIDALEGAFSSDGIKGVVNLLTGDKDGYNKNLQKEYNRLKAREEASPAQLEKLDLEEKLQREANERIRLQKQMEEHLNRAQQANEEADKKSMESQVNPVFEKYRFAGKLGDPVMEHHLDEAIWEQVKKRFSEYPDDKEVTSQDIDKEFRTVSSMYRKIINKQADQKSRQVIEKKKQAAQENVAVKAINGIRRSSESEAFKNDIKSGNLTGALTSLLTGKFKF
jgi:hypothetical protein